MRKWKQRKTKGLHQTEIIYLLMALYIFRGRERKYKDSVSYDYISKETLV